MLQRALPMDANFELGFKPRMACFANAGQLGLGFKPGMASWQCSRAHLGSGKGVLAFFLQIV